MTVSPQIREWIQRLVQEKIAPHAFAHSKTKIERRLLDDLNQESLMTLMVPESLGGSGLSSREFSFVIREISKVCGSVGVTVAVTNMVAETLAREGTSEQCAEFLTPLVQGRFPTASFCLTENQSGSDAKALKTSATLVGDHVELSGEKLYVTNGAFSGVFLVMARDGDGISAFLVPREAKGLLLGKEEDKMGLTGSSTIRLVLDRVRVPLEHRLGAAGEGFKIAMRSLDSGRISVASQALGIAQASLEAGLSYAQEREAFGSKLSEFQALQWKIADSATALAASELLIERAAHLKDSKQPFTREASMAKVFTTEKACRVCEEMLQIHGGYGYIKDYPVERFYRDVRVTTLYEGTSEIQRLVIARDLLKQGA